MVEKSTQSAVARELDVPRQYIQQILSNERPISESLALKLGYMRVWKKVRQKRSEAV